MRSYSEIHEFIEENDVEFIRLAYFDVFGTQKNIAIMSGELERAMKYGISIDGAAVAGFDADIRSDLFLRPDPSTISIVPWRPADGRVCRMFCDIVYPDGTPFERDTRYMLKKAMQEARSKGFEVKFGPEVEFYVFRQDERGRKTDIPIDQAGYMDVDPLDAGENLRRDICYALVEMGITPESSHHEQGPGQMEIDFRYGDPLTAADNTSTFKWAVRSICAADGYAADFSPKPLSDKPGNGMHLNISVHRIHEEDNPAEQSYWRFGRMEAPRYISWSKQNRSQLIRVPADPSGRRRIELRSPDPLANPYLAFALLIYAGLEGISQNMTPPQSIEANLYREDPALMRGLEQLPASKQEAMQCAMESELIRHHVPKSCLEAYVYEGKK